MNPKVVFEIGVGQPSVCRTIDFIKNGANVVMFEPNPDNYKSLIEMFGSCPNVTIHNIALQV